MHQRARLNESMSRTELRKARFRARYAHRVFNSVRGTSGGWEAEFHLSPFRHIALMSSLPR